MMNNGRFGFVNGATDALASVAERVCRSLVVVQGHRFGAGAGIVWREDGIILTNNHVVNSHTPHVFLPGGQEYRASILARDPDVDLAVLHIDADNLFPALVADSRRLQVGQFVLAVGHPWGQRGYVTAGVISALVQTETRQPGRQVTVIRTDALLAPGNSGGPLVDAAGAVIGINTLIVGGDQSVALPSHLAEAVVSRAAPHAGRERGELQPEFGITNQSI